MIDLKDALDVLHELHELRTRAKELREQGRTALKQIKVLSEPGPNDPPLTDEEKEALDRFGRDHWISSGNNVEVGLLVKVQNHKDLSEEESENDSAEASPRLRESLLAVELNNLFPRPDTEVVDQDEERGDRRLPVLVAARTMQALVSRSKTVFSKATLHCYYRIVRELYLAAPPDWTMGAARAGQNGTTSAFVTGECIRAVFGFENAMRRTAFFLRQTHRLLGRYELLKEMTRVFDGSEQNGAKKANGSKRPAGVNAKQNSMDLWANRAIERMWFDWHISTNARDGNIGLDLDDGFFANTAERVDMQLVGEYLAGLTDKLENAVERAKEQVDKAYKNVLEFRQGQAESLKNAKRRPNKTPTEIQNDEKRARDFDRSESAHKFAASLIAKATHEGQRAAEFIEKAKQGEKPLDKILEELEKQFSRMADDVHRVLEPSRRYIRTVLHREVASTAFGRFDAGELVFAAASYGAITGWKPSELLSRACDLLVGALPENGRLPTTRPFHSTLKGHRMLPIGCEMTRGLAQLLQRNASEFEPKLVRRMLNIFEEKMIHLGPLDQNTRLKRAGWNFDGSPHPNRPCVWVTAVSVLAIDRIVRMLNERINSIVFKYFEVIKPEKPHSSMTLNDLIYPDFAFSEYYHPSQLSIGLRLEQMRGHVMRVTLPKVYRDAKGKKERVFSAIFYGPPGTGKTTLVEALALSSNVPLIRLSPSDLVVQGPAAIEGRARYVFEALSMLTQVVIILDEFEEVVGKRTPTGAENREKIFDFLRTGMLPKLIKLNDAARTQSFVYCLGTNYLEKIEPAAMRRGRFDFKLPVYDPDALSRAGTLLYRLSRIVLKLEEHKRLPETNGSMPQQFLAVVEKTRNTRASSFAQDYLRVPDWVVKKDGKCPDGDFAHEIPLFWYVLTGEDVGYGEKIKLAVEEGRRSDDDHDEFCEKYASPDEKEESEWLVRYEAQLTRLSKRSAFAISDVWTSLAKPTKHAGKQKASTGKKSRRP